MQYCERFLTGYTCSQQPYHEKLLKTKQDTTLTMRARSSSSNKISKDRLFGAMFKRAIGKGPAASENLLHRYVFPPRIIDNSIEALSHNTDPLVQKEVRWLRDEGPQTKEEYKTFFAVNTERPEMGWVDKTSTGRLQSSGERLWIGRVPVSRRSWSMRHSPVSFDGRHSPKAV